MFKLIRVILKQCYHIVADVGFPKTITKRKHSLKEILKLLTLMLQYTTTVTPNKDNIIIQHFYFIQSYMSCISTL